MSVALLFAHLVGQENDKLQRALHDISVHIGGSPGLPETVVQAAQTARERLNQYQGHSGIPRDADGHPVPFALVGR